MQIGPTGACSPTKKWKERMRTKGVGKKTLKRFREVGRRKTGGSRNIKEMLRVWRRQRKRKRTPGQKEETSGAQKT
ncbi:hypothetical protein NDU88_008728 [Pleurodeles waltl]|uniref:Uncharacterized protein n=1 Tax=Pleurodeles waltl TaxID=8319 RepID=A0AAV7QQK2_PLEWA|nr:hypothetical protein NDU88_008728 [Pleurodeles waltl]